MLYILESYDEEYSKDNALIYDRPNLYCAKGEIRDMVIFNLKTKERKVVAKVVGLGYADFKDEQDFRERFTAVLRRKLMEVDMPEKAVLVKVQPLRE